MNYLTKKQWRTWRGQTPLVWACPVAGLWKDRWWWQEGDAGSPSTALWVGLAITSLLIGEEMGVQTGWVTVSPKVKWLSSGRAEICAQIWLTPEHIYFLFWPPSLSSALFPFLIPLSIECYQVAVNRVVQSALPPPLLGSPSLFPLGLANVALASLCESGPSDKRKMISPCFYHEWGWASLNHLYLLFLVTIMLPIFNISLLIFFLLISRNFLYIKAIISNRKVY